MTRLHDCDGNGKPWSEYDFEDEARDEARISAELARGDDDEEDCDDC